MYCLLSCVCKMQDVLPVALTFWLLFSTSAPSFQSVPYLFFAGVT